MGASVSVSVRSVTVLFSAAPVSSATYIPQEHDFIRAGGAIANGTIGNGDSDDSDDDDGDDDSADAAAAAAAGGGATGEGEEGEKGEVSRQMAALRKYLDDQVGRWAWCHCPGSSRRWLRLSAAGGGVWAASSLRYGPQPGFAFTCVSLDGDDASEAGHPPRRRRENVQGTDASYLP